MQKIGEMTKGFISTYLTEEPMIINSRYTFSLPLYTIGILFMELLEKGYLQLNQNDEIEIKSSQDTNHVYLNQLILCIQNSKKRTCKEWIHYFSNERKVMNKIFIGIVKEMEQEGIIQYQSKKRFSFISTQEKIEYIGGTNTFVEHIKKDLLLKKNNKFEIILLLWKYYYGSYINEQEILFVQKEQNIHRFVQQVQEGIVEGAQRSVLFV
ncbi:hypothetical protein U9K47_18660 [Bacillus toyonensis]|uniref:hypothetical protein n=1 Tax=Bacillus toyonensis TaxID=155322 RepID=UPI00346654FE